MESRDTILEYWFGTNTDDAAVAEDRASLWWSKNSRVDQEIRARFEAQVVAAESGALDTWRSSPHGALALILLTDQFPRNIYRGSADAFRFDPIARELCESLLGSGSDRKLRPIHRVFVYMPLEHSEDLEHQTRCVKLFQELVDHVTDDLRPTFDRYLDYAVRHKAIIERFGRFPHRNAILGRPSTNEELEFLKTPGSSF